MVSRETKEEKKKLRQTERRSCSGWLWIIHYRLVHGFFVASDIVIKGHARLCVRDSSTHDADNAEAVTQFQTSSNLS